MMLKKSVAINKLIMLIPIHFLILWICFMHFVKAIMMLKYSETWEKKNENPHSSKIKIWIITDQKEDYNDVVTKDVAAILHAYDDDPCGNCKLIVYPIDPNNTVQLVSIYHACLDPIVHCCFHVVIKVRVQICVTIHYVPHQFDI